MLVVLMALAGHGLPAAAAEEVFVEPKSYNSPRDLRDIPSIPITSWLNIGVLVEGEAQYKEEDGQSGSNVSVDAFSLAARAQWWEWLSAFAVAKHELNRGRDVGVEEAFVHVGATDSCPWYAEAGRMEMPFGEFEGRFVEDPLVQIIGETEGDGYVAGYETDVFEAVVSMFQGNLADNDTDNVVGTIKLDPWEGVEFGVSFTSDLGESSELAVLQREFLLERQEEASEEDEPGDSALPLVLSDHAVAGLGAFVLVDLKSWVYGFELITALDDFDVGVLDVREQKPWGWNAEIAHRPASGLELAARLEYSKELPGEPEWQSGVAVVWAVIDHVTIGANYLHGTFRDGRSARDLIGMELAIEF